MNCNYSVLFGIFCCYNTVPFFEVWHPKAGLNIVQRRHNSTHKKHIVQETSWLRKMCASL